MGQPSESNDERPQDIQEAVVPRANGGRPEIFKSTTQEILFVFMATMAVGVSSFVSGVAVVLSAYVGHSLHMTTSEISWINASTGLAGGSFLLFFGRIADFFGGKSLCIVSLAAFTVICTGAGFSENGITLDVLSGLMGLTSASVVPPALGILGAAYTPSKRKNYAFACFGAGNPLGFVFGAIISGIATDVASWRASYWTLAVIYAVVTIMALWCVPRDTSEKKVLSLETAKEFDIPGVFLTISGIALFSTALTQGSGAGWATPYVIVLLVLGILLIAGFVWWEHICSHPITPPKMFKDRNFSLLLIILTLGFMSFPASLFWTSLYMQNVWNLSPLMVAVHLLPAAVMGTLYNVIAGMLLHKVSNKLLVFLGTVAYTIAFLLMAVQRNGDSYWAFFFPALSIVVVGADFHFNVCNMYVMQSRPPSEQAVAGGILQTFTKLAVPISFGIATAIFDRVRENPPTSGYYAGNAAAPYAAVFWFCMACTAISIALVPFLTIGTQGNEISPGALSLSTGSEETKMRSTEGSEKV